MELAPKAAPTQTKAMQIEVSTDKNISGNETFAHHVEQILNETLSRFSDQITRVQVHLSDENSASKSGTRDMRCLLEVRLAGRDPSSVSEQAFTMEQAIHGAAQKMVHLLDSELGRLANH
jgi:ribosome-associated translation inhibitor RaiA